MLALYVLFPRGDTEELSIAPTDLIKAESPQLSETPTLPNEAIIEPETVPVTEPVTEPVTILIEIKGSVSKPGVFELPAGSRLHTAIDLAGGLLPEADALSLNLAMKLTDEMSVFVPEIGEAAITPPVIAAPVSPSLPSSSSEDALSGGGPVNINTADETAMMTLPGIGPSKAAAIIAYREENGPFASIEALKDVTGIGDKTFEQLKDSISIN